MQLFVRNNNDFNHTDFFNGDEYTFPAGEKILVDAEAAQHMLGFGRKDKTENLIRLGWANHGEVGVKKLANFVFTQPVMIEAPADDEDSPAETVQPVTVTPPGSDSGAATIAVDSGE